MVAAWDAYANRISNPSVTWSVIDSRAGEIDANGVFTARCWPGTYSDVVWATSTNGLTDTVYLPLMLRE